MVLRFTEVTQRRRGYIMLTYSQLNSAIMAYPNDQELGAFVRSLYYTEQRRQQQLLTDSLGKGET